MALFWPHLNIITFSFTGLKKPEKIGFYAAETKFLIIILIFINDKLYALV